MRAQLTGDRRSDGGFTLVEALVALTLTAGVGLALLQAYLFGSHSWERASERSQTIEDRLLVYETVRGWIENLAPLRVTDRPEFQIFPIEGTPTTLTLTGYLLRDGDRQGQTRIAISFDQNTATLSLRLVGEEVALSMINPEGRDRVMLTGIEDLTFGYFERGGPGKPGRWIERWEHRQDLPAAIRMSLRERGDRRDSWPPLIVRPKVEDDVSCTYDPVTRNCRDGGA